MMMIAAGEKPTSVRSEPKDDAEIMAELCSGEAFAVLDISGGWAWGYRRLDHKVGYVPLGHLQEGSPPAGE